MNQREKQIVSDVKASCATRGRFGFYRGLVVSIDDPKRLERVKTRVWAIHGPQSRTPDTALPWANMSDIGGGGYDYGSFDPPPVGSGVWVGFEQGIEDHPIIFGTFRGIPVRDSLNANIFLNSDGLNEDEVAWLPPDGESETPKDIFDDSHAGDNHPTRRVWRKSFKGHTILVEDGDGKEFLRIIDRSGQVIEMYCPTAPDAEWGSSCAEGNSAQRGARSTLRGDQLPQDAMRDKTAHIRIKDIAGQEILLDGRSANERIRLISRDSRGTSSQVIEMNSGKGKEGIRLCDMAGNEIILDPNGVEGIVLRDKSGTKFALRPGKGFEMSSASNLTETAARDKATEIEGSHNNKIAGDLDQTIAGNLKTNVGNAATFGVAGNTATSFGGIIQMLIANAGLETTAFDISIANGGLSIGLFLGDICFDITTSGDITFKTAAGDILHSTLLGNVGYKTEVGDATLEVGTQGDVTAKTALGNATLSTKLGDVTASTGAGDATLSTEVGNVLVKTSLGNAELSATGGNAIVDGVLVQLGGAAAVEPLIKGLELSSGASTILSQFSSAVASAASGTGTAAQNAAAIAAIAAAVTAYTTALSALLTSSLSAKSFTV